MKEIMMTTTKSPASTQRQETTEEHAKAMLANFRRLWEQMDPRIVEEIVAPDATSFWSGRGPFRGTDYPEQMRFTMESVPDAKLEVAGHAIDLPYLFISWIIRGTYADAPIELHGIDRFHLRGELADDVWAIFDTGPLRESLERGEDQTAPGSVDD
jgi:hypothetical protein